MKASPDEQRALLDLQDADNRLQRVAHGVATLPGVAQLAALAPDVEAVRVRHVGKTGELEDAGAELKRIESDVQVVEARIGRDTARIESTASVKDVDALETELAALRKRRSDLEDIELTVMERIETLEGEAAAIEAERDELAARVSALEGEVESERAALAAKGAEITTERSAIAAGVADDLLALYERQRARYGIGAALIRGGVSLGSNVKLTGSDLEAVRNAAPDDVVLDPDSNCILVRTEESGL